MEHDRSVVRLLWATLRGGHPAPGRLPAGISLVAARHRVTVPTYRLLTADPAGRDRVDHDDWTLLRASASYNRHRTARFMEVLTAASREVSARWLTWKAGALAFTMADYPLLAEAADVDIIVEESGVEEWARFLQSRPGVITKSRHTDDGRLRAFQARVVVEPEVALVWDVKAAVQLPGIVLADGVPVAAPDDHLGLLSDHVDSHARDVDGCRLRMFYDAALAGAPWADAGCEEHLLGATPSGV